MTHHVEHAVELELDAVAAAEVQALFDALESAGVESLAAGAPLVHPHVSVAVARDAAPELIADVLRGVVTDPLPSLTLSSLGAFLAPASVLFLGVTPTRELLGLNAAVHARLDHAGISVRPLYRPGSYVPHCTLAMHPPSLDAAIRAVLVAPLPVGAVAVAMRVVEVPTGKVRATVG
ncbi:MAG TPA: 2'-5' RNA ligase family protein [Acidimicrobiales bacterium]|nr:2'-5' RNA ligase family protein [Acidimicrobiales bacterium]